LENTENTFVTPVFNGSASLRDAAGNLIETVNKAVKNNKVIDDSYLEGMFSETKSQYHLDQITATDGKVTLGELPVASWVLIRLLAVCWILMLIYVGINKINKKN
jgi:multiple sugar transport system substrate-binding protein